CLLRGLVHRCANALEHLLHFLLKRLGLFLSTDSPLRLLGPLSLPLKRLVLFLLLIAEDEAEEEIHEEDRYERVFLEEFKHGIDPLESSARRPTTGSGKVSCV